jgi:hypothetical protein
VQKKNRSNVADNKKRVQAESSDSDNDKSKTMQTTKNSIKQTKKAVSRSRSRSKSKEKEKKSKINRDRSKSKEKDERPYKDRIKIVLPDSSKEKLVKKEDSNPIKGNTAESKRSLLWSGSEKDESTVKKWEFLSTDTDDKNKFLKLMGLKKGVSETEKPDNNVSQYISTRKEIVVNPETKEQMKQELEKQFQVGMLRRDGRKNGLGW